MNKLVIAVVAGVISCGSAIASAADTMSKDSMRKEERTESRPEKAREARRDERTESKAEKGREARRDERTESKAEKRREAGRDERTESKAEKAREASTRAHGVDAGKSGYQQKNDVSK